MRTPQILETWVAAVVIATGMLPVAGWADGQGTGTTNAPHAQAARSAQETLREYLRLEEQVQTQFKGQQYEQAAAACREQIRLAPKSAAATYNLACALARLGRADEALTNLAAAVAFGFIDAAHIQADADLASLRGLQGYAGVLAQVHAAEKKIDAAPDLPGIKSVTGSPEGGFRYRLRLGAAATKEQPHRLVVWMHPSGGSMNEQAEALAPLFARHGYAVLVLTLKNFLGWSEQDGARLMQTIAAAGQTEGVDASRPLLFGFSAGGQMALLLFAAQPQQWGGLILDAAYPVRQTMGADGKTQTTLLKLPENAALKPAPWFVLVGAKDGGARVWKDNEEHFRTQYGVPLTLHIVPEKSHAWLFDGAAQEQLEQWLKDLQARDGWSTTPAAL